MKRLFSLIEYTVIFLSYLLVVFLPLKKVIESTQAISNFFTKISPERSSHAKIFKSIKQKQRRLGINSCLKQSIAQKIIFAILGHETTIICGVRKKSMNELDGHAWLIDKYGKNINEHEPLESFITSF